MPRSIQTTINVGDGVCDLCRGSELVAGWLIPNNSPAVRTRLCRTCLRCVAAALRAVKRELDRK
jgi:hypothetical protein